MSYFTSLTYYRPCVPPVVTADALSRFMAAICDTKLLTDDGFRWLKVKFGRAIDQDDLGTTRKKVTVPGVSVVQEIDWDIELSDDPDHREMIAVLAAREHRVYRAAISFGMPVEDVLRPITRENSPENEVNDCPDALSINIGPVACFDLGTDQPLHVGWMRMDLSGGGYLFPWTFRDAVGRLQRSREIQRLTEVCQSFWPVRPDPPERHIIRLRREFRDLWPHDEFDRPWDWYWGLRESG